MSVILILVSTCSNFIHSISVPWFYNKLYSVTSTFFQFCVEFLWFYSFILTLNFSNLIWFQKNLPLNLICICSGYLKGSVKCTVIRINLQLTSRLSQFMQHSLQVVKKLHVSQRLVSCNNRTTEAVYIIVIS